MGEEPQIGDRVWRAVETHRCRALQQLDAVAANSLGDLFPSRYPPSADTFDEDLAALLARDLTAMGMAVHDSSRSVPAGGVWLGPCAEYPGVIVVWTQHEASAAVLGARRHCEVQESMNFELCEVLRILGYTVKAYGQGGAHVVTARGSQTPR